MGLLSGLPFGKLELGEKTAFYTFLYFSVLPHTCITFICLKCEQRIPGGGVRSWKAGTRESSG